MPVTTPFDIATARYVSLATFRRNGEEVATPVWIASAAGKHYVFSAGEAGKIKRLRHNPRVRVAQCTGTGRLKSDWCEGRGRIVTDAATRALAHRALRQKYGFPMWAADVGAKLMGRYHQRAFIEIEI